MAKSFAVFASGYGSNLQAIIDAVSCGSIKAKLALLVTDNKNAYAIKRAKRAGIPILIAEKKRFPDKRDFENHILCGLKEHDIDFIVLAGFMRLLSAAFVRKYKNKIINVHPALLPSFKGADGIGDALRYGVKYAGVSVHFVDEGIDSGPIIAQEAVIVKNTDTYDSLAKRIHNLEHKIYPKAIKLFCEGKLKISGRKVIVSA